MCIYIYIYSFIHLILSCTVWFNYTFEEPHRNVPEWKWWKCENARTTCETKQLITSGCTENSCIEATRRSAHLDWRLTSIDIDWPCRTSVESKKKQFVNVWNQCTLAIHRDTSVTSRYNDFPLVNLATDFHYSFSKPLHVNLRFSNTAPASTQCTSHKHWWRNCKLSCLGPPAVRLRAWTWENMSCDWNDFEKIWLNNYE